MTGTNSCEGGIIHSDHTRVSTWTAWLEFQHHVSLTV